MADFMADRMLSAVGAVADGLDDVPVRPGDELEQAATSRPAAMRIDTIVPRWRLMT